MNFTDAVKAVFKKYIVFEGRSLRSEFWYWILFTFIMSIVLSIFDSILFNFDPNTFLSNNGPLEIVFNLATLIPSIAVGARRLHDLDKSGWWQLIALTGIGLIPLIIWFARQGTPGDNRFGPPAPTKP
jgi:uncharacterized membrane protein YhaH (DUF805 family)